MRCMKGYPREVINNLYCDDCNYSTQKKNLMEAHKRTEKHKRNSEKKYKVYHGPEEIDRQMEKKKAKRISIFDNYQIMDEHYTNMDKLFEGRERGEYEKSVMSSYDNLVFLEKQFKELPDSNILEKMKCKMLLDMVRDGHKNIVDGYCKTYEHVMNHRQT